MKQFVEGQAVIYTKGRTATAPATDFEGVYVGEVQFSATQRRHKIQVVVDGRLVDRYVATTALRSKVPA